MTEESVASKAAPSQESKGFPLWTAVSAALAVVLVGAFFYFWVSSSGWLFYKTQSIYGDLIAPVFFFVISLALLRNLWQNRDEDKNDRVRRVVGLAVYGFFLVIGFTYSLDPQSDWFFYKLKDNDSNLTAILFFAFMLSLYVFWQNSEEKNRRLYAMEIAAFIALVATDFIYLVKTNAPVFFTIIQDKDKYVIAPIFFLLISAPLSFYLWLCRHEDKLEQIKQTNDQNILNRLSNAMQFLLEKKNKHANAAGLKFLAKIKNESKTFNAEIDMATSGANLKSTDLTGANLTNIDLSRADLERASLSDVNLANAKLVDSDLSQATLIGTNLTGSNLTRATIKGAFIGIYKAVRKKEFYREEIENHLKQDWKTQASEEAFDVVVQILVRKDEESKEVYYFDETPDSPSGTSGIAPDKPGQDPTAPIVPPRTPFSPKSYQSGSLRPDAPKGDSGDTINTSPRSAEDYNKRGIAKMEAEDYDGAIADFDNAIKFNSGYTVAYVNRGVARMKKHGKEENEE